MALPAQRGDDDIDDCGDYCGDDGNTGTFNTKRLVRITMVILMTISVMMVILKYWHLQYNKAGEKNNDETHELGCG